VGRDGIGPSGVSGGVSGGVPGGASTRPPKHSAAGSGFGGRQSRAGNGACLQLAVVVLHVALDGDEGRAAGLDQLALPRPGHLRYGACTGCGARGDRGSVYPGILSLWLILGKWSGTEIEEGVVLGWGCWDALVLWRIHLVEISALGDWV
jgi:hypothetical protein